MKPTLSVITICFNNLTDLIRTCQSVDSQTLHPDEHLIIDGSSTDEILNWLVSNTQPYYRRWVHERDKGIADAFNKGILLARGTVIHLLNSGDLYADPAAINKVTSLFESEPSLMWVHSRYIQHRGDRDVISGVPFDKKQVWKGMRTIAHPGMFIKKEVYDRNGLYNLEYEIAMDYDMLLRIRNEKNRFIPEPLVYFAPGGASNVHFRKGLGEVKRSHRQHIGSSFSQSLWQLRQRLLQGFMETSVGKAWFRWKNKKKISKSL
jgi:glycosyltransferase involved in cell wall biosynthesis